MTANNSNLDRINVNAYMKFGEILSICPQVICAKNDLYQSQARSCKYQCIYKFGEILSLGFQDIEQK